MMSATGERIDLDAHYTADGYRGIAFYLLGYVERETPETEWTGDRETDTDWVRAVMVGDDREHEIEVSDLRPLAREDFCGECGQIGCRHDGLVREDERTEVSQ